jgi:hypothetical protein
MRSLPMHRSQSRDSRWSSLQIVKKHDVDSAVRILLRNGGSSFEEKVIKWGAVHADERR